MLNKEKVIESIQEMPANFSTDDLIERILFIDKVEKGLQDISNGKVVEDEKLDKQLVKWLG